MVINKVGEDLPKEGKYIVFLGGTALVFSGHANHFTMLSAHAKGRTARSAGYYKVKDDGTLLCYGFSKSLGIGYMAGDEDVVRKDLAL